MWSSGPGKRAALYWLRSTTVTVPCDWASPTALAEWHWYTPSSSFLRGLIDLEVKQASLYSHIWHSKITYLVLNDSEHLLLFKIRQSSPSISLLALAAEKELNFLLSTLSILALILMFPLHFCLLL